MSFVHVRLIEEVFTPTDKTEIVATPSWTWADIQDVLSAEWEIGGRPGRPTQSLRFVAGE